MTGPRDELRDLVLLRRQLRPGRLLAPRTRGLAARAQLASRAARPRHRIERVEGLQRRAEVLARIDAAPPPAQGRAVREFGARPLERALPPCVLSERLPEHRLGFLGHVREQGTAVGTRPRAHAASDAAAKALSSSSHRCASGRPARAAASIRSSDASCATTGCVIGSSCANAASARPAPSSSTPSAHRAASSIKLIGWVAVIARARCGGIGDGTVRVWRMADGTPVGEPLTGHDGTMTAVAAGTLPDGTPVIISGSGGRTVRVWQTADGIPVVPPLHLPELAQSLALHGNVVITAAGADIAVHQPTLPRSMR